MIPSDIATKLLQLSSDPCAVVERNCLETAWTNPAWRALEALVAALGQTSYQAGTPPAEAPQLTQQTPMATLLAAVDDQPVCQIACWEVAGRAAFEATVTVYPFTKEGKPMAAVFILSPRPAIGLSSFDDLAYRAMTDPLTGLASRAAIDHRIEQLALLPSANKNDLAILFIDLNGFKKVNDQWGHLVGDDVLTTVAQRLAKVARTTDLIARFGGDEFIVLAEGVTERESLAPLIGRLRQAAEEPIEVAGKTLQISASIGLALSSEGIQSVYDLISEADRRMYAEKQLHAEEQLSQ